LLWRLLFWGKLRRALDKLDFSKNEALARALNRIETLKHAIASNPATEVVVTCGGRTRSIIGAQSLINIGVPHEF
jgi:rhodanese-related sulfurtransferase